MSSEKITHLDLAQDHKKMADLLEQLKVVAEEHKEHLSQLSTNSVILAEVSKDIGENNRELIKQNNKKQTAPGVPLKVFFLVVGTVCLTALIAIVSLAHVNLVVKSNSVSIVSQESQPIDKKPNLKIGKFKDIGVQTQHFERK